MPELDDLTLAYLQAHPIDAARELERLSAQDVTALLEQAPARLTGPVLEAMLPGIAAAGVTPLPVAQAALSLGAMRAPGAAGILRHMPEALRQTLLAELPTAMALACRTLLRYPDDAIGALVDTGVVSLPVTARVHEALEAVRRRSGDADADVYVVSEDLRLSGVVTLAALLRADGSARLDTLQRRVPALPALMPWSGAAADKAWNEANSLPVVEYGGRFLGALSALALRQALAARRGAAVRSGDSLAGLMGEGYWVAVASLSEAIVALLPTSPGRST